MMQEREILIKKVFPKIRKYAKERFVEVTEIDLRWGVTQLQSDNGETLEICLNEIDKCSNSDLFFIGILGNRYGWIPPREDIRFENSQKYSWLQEYDDRSVTELEIIFGVLKNRPPSNKSFFYFREESLSKKIESQIHSEDENFVSDTKVLNEKQQSLKQEIEQYQSASVQNYSSLEEFGRSVLADLKTAIWNLYPLEKIPSELERERNQHTLFAQSRRGFYIKNPEMFQDLDEAMESSFNFIALEGVSGLGKSALMANYFEHYKHNSKNQDMLFIEYYVSGVSHKSSDHTALIQRIIKEIDAFSNKNEELEILHTDETELIQMLERKLTELGTTPCIIFIDAVNQFIMPLARELHWLENSFSGNIKILFSTTQRIDESSLLKEKQCRVITQKPLTYKNKIVFIEEYLHYYGKSLSFPFIERIAQESRTDNPLYLKVMLNELRVFGVFEDVEEYFEKLLGAQNLKQLFQHVFKRLETDYEQEHPNLVREILSLLWVSKDGLSENEIFEILNYGRSDKQPYLTQRVFSPLLIALEEHLVDLNGQLNFSHLYIKEAVESQYLASEPYINVQRKKIVSYFKDQEFSQRKVTELPHQLKMLGDRKDLLGLLFLDSEMFDVLHNSALTELISYAYFIQEDETLSLQERVYEERMEYYESSLDLNEDAQEEILLSLNNVAVFFKHMMNFGYALKFYLSIIDSFLKFENIPTQMLASIYNNVAVLYRNLGKQEKSIGYYEKAEEMMSNLGQSSELSTLRYNIASYYVNNDQVEIGLEKLLEVEKDFIKIFGVNSLDTSRVYNSLGSVYIGLKKYNEAQYYLQKAIDIQKSVLGEDNYITSTSYANLAGVFISRSEEGDTHRAIEIYEEALSYMKNIDDHPVKANLFEGISLAYRQLDEIELSLDMLKRSIEIYISLYGENDKRTLMKMKLYKMLSDGYKDASKKESVDKSLGYEMYQKKISQAISDQDYLSAVIYAKKVLKTQIDRYGEDSKEVAQAYNNLAYCAKCNGDMKEALDFYASALQISINIDPDSQDTMLFAHNMAELYIADKEYELALKLYNMELQIRRKLDLDDTVALAKNYNNLGFCFLSMNRADEAVHLYEECLGFRIEVLGYGHSDTLYSIHNLSLAYYEIKNIEKYLDHMDLLLKIYEEIQHPKMEDTYQEIFNYLIGFGDFVACAESIIKILESFSEEHQKHFEKTHHFFMVLVPQLKEAYESNQH